MVRVCVLRCWCVFIGFFWGGVYKASDLPNLGLTHVTLSVAYDLTAMEDRGPLSTWLSAHGAVEVRS